ncbi:MAG: TetR/AcrR family transcriptional regulator [bacterium]
MRNSKKQNRKEQLLRIASIVFAEKGYHATSIDDIKKRAGVARGTVYNYFDSKRDIFDMLIRDYTQSILSHISIFDTSSSLSLIEQFNKNVSGIVEIISRNKELTRIISSEAVGLDSEFDHQLILFYAQLSEYIEGALTMLQKNGDIDSDINVRLLAFALIGTIKEVTYQWALDKGSVLDMDPLIKSLQHFDISRYINFRGNFLKDEK